MKKAMIPALAFLALAASAEEAFVKLPPPVYAGLVKDYMQQPCGCEPSVGVIVRRAADNKLLASAQTTFALQGVNYVVALPMLSAKSEAVTGLLYGEEATFSFLDGDVLWANLATVKTDKPGFHRLDVTLGKDENNDGIADRYAEYMQLKMQEYGLAGTYDPEADYNKDGVTNREHYLAGTNPFAGLTVGGVVIAESTCTISSLMNVRTFAGKDMFAITFNALEDVCYTVIALDDLSKGWGEAKAVESREDANAVASEANHYADTAGEMTLYVPKGTGTQCFYKLMVQE